MTDRVSVENAFALVVAAAVVLFALGSSDIETLRSIGSPGRWLALLAAVMLALVLAARARKAWPPVPLRWLISIAAVLVALAYLSSAWSVAPRLTVERATTLLLLVTLASAAAYAAAGEPRLARLTVEALVVGVFTVVALSLVWTAFKPLDAIQAAPTRFKGVGENPNTVALLLGMSFPLCGWFVLTRKTIGSRVGSAAILALSYLALVLSGSRGAIVAAFTGTIVALVLAHQRRVGLPVGAVGAVVVAIVGAAAAASTFALIAVAPALQRGYLEARGAPAIVAPPAPVTTPDTGSFPSPGRLEDELGKPGRVSSVPGRHPLLSSSGRVEAWQGAVEQGMQRPIAGYGFGTEDRVFVDRFYWFQGSRPENSFVGIFLQLGVVGVLLLAMIVAAVAVPVLLACRRRLPLAPLLAATVGVVAGGAASMMFQSYVYSVGNIGSLSFWLCAFISGSIVCVRSEVPIT